MTSAQMYEIARDAVIEAENIQPEDENQPDVLWVGGVLEDRRGIVWCGGKLYMVRYDASGKELKVDRYSKEE